MLTHKLFVMQSQDSLKIKNLRFYLLPEPTNMGLKSKKQQKKMEKNLKSLLMKYLKTLKILVKSLRLQILIL